MRVADGQSLDIVFQNDDELNEFLLIENSSTPSEDADFGSNMSDEEALAFVGIYPTTRDESASEDR